MDGRHRNALGGVGVPLGVVQHLLVGPPAGSLHPGRQPVHAHRLAGCGPSPQASGAGSSRLVMKVPSGWHTPSSASAPSSSAMLSPTSVLETPTIRPARRYDSPSNMHPATASSRTASGSGGLPPWPGGRVGAGGPGDRPARPSPGRAARSAGSRTRGPDLQAGVRTLPMVWSPSFRTHRASRTASMG